ncbi:MAG: hypothetical protein ACK46A_14440 [Akkermansiaceae bacterium]|jgi:hypothetical protein
MFEISPPDDNLEMKEVFRGGGFHPPCQVLITQKNISKTADKR